MKTHDLLADAAIRINALVGTDPVELQETYTTRPLTDELFQSSIFPMGAIISALVLAQGKLVEAIALSDKRTQLAYFKSLTASLPTSSPLPSVDASGNSIIGNFGACVDASTLDPLTRKSIPFVQNILKSADNYLVDVDYYSLASGYIQHTHDNVKLECFVYDADAQTNRYKFNNDFPLADALAEAVICGACAMLVRDDEFSDQASRWAGYFATELANYPPTTMEAQAA
jgi:hypothetical protein